jgi:hypothetical protein
VPGADALVEELEGQLAGLVDDALDRPDARQTLKLIIPASDRAKIRGDVRKQVLDKSDDLLTQTNPEISDVREARLAQAKYETPSYSVPRAQRPRRRAQLRRFGVVLWFGIAFPIAVWQSWHILSGNLPGFVAVLIDIAAAVGLLALAGPIHRGTGETMPAVNGPVWTFTAGVGATYLLLLWRLWTPTEHAVGDFWRWPLWILITLVFAFIFVVASFLVAVGNVKDSKIDLIPWTVAWPGVLTALWAGLATAIPLVLPVRHWWVAVAPILVALVVQVLIGPWVVTNRSSLKKIVPARLSRDPSRHGSIEWMRESRRLATAAHDSMQVWRAAAEKAVSASVALRLDEVIQPPFSIELGELDRGGLGQMRAGDRFVPTAAFAGMRELTEGITGGAIGLAGPRGAGKSTLLESYREGRFLRPGNEHVALLESVPVRYDAREFALHLYARTCTEVIRFCERQETEVRSPWPRRLAWCRQWAPVLIVLAAWLAVGFVGAGAIAERHLDLLNWVATLWWPIVVVAGAGTTLYLASGRRQRRVPEPVDITTAVRKPAALVRLAEQRLESIQFQQKHTSGWSGKIGLLFGAEAQRSASRELTLQPMSYPQVVHEFSTFLAAAIQCLSRVPTVATPSVVIILDELDKILSPEQAQDFVNEVKALFSLEVPGFLFLVSVSEDALSSFERRGLPVRDAFDSAFDAIFRVEYLKLDDSRAILKSRILLLPEPFICLCHCMAGGLPRELVRVARQVVAKRGTLAKVCRDVVAADLRGKVAGLRTLIARHGQVDVPASELMRHVDAHAVADAATLLNALAKPPIQQTDTMSDDLAALLHLQLETLGYLYYCATILEVFGPGFSRQDMAKGRDSGGDASFDTLTSVRQLFSVNARLAWLTVSAFRTAWGRDAVDPPV